MKRRVWLPVLIVFALIGIAALAGRSPEEPVRAAMPSPPEPGGGVDPWTDAAALREQFAWACEAVERICGAAFDPRPTIHSCTTQQFALVCAAIGEESDPLTVLASPGREPGARGLKAAECCVGICASSVNAVFLHPDGMRQYIAEARAACSTMTIDLLRLALVHEAAHILDAQRWPHFATDRLAVDEDLKFDMVVMIEGHAEYVVSEVAHALGAAGAYDEYVAVTRSMACEATFDTQDVAQYGNIEYGRGLQILKRAKDLGGAALVERVISHPPPYLGSPDWETELLLTRLAELQR